MEKEERFKQELITFGTRLRRIRETKGQSQLDLEMETGIARTEISRIENGQKNIEFFTLVKLAAGLKIKLRDLFDD